MWGRAAIATFGMLAMAQGSWGDAPRAPSRCVALPPGADVQAALDASPLERAFCLAPGEYVGPIVLSRSVLLWGPRTARVVSRGTGSTVIVRAPDTTLAGFSIDGSGGRFELSDAAVRVVADDVRVEGLHIERALFGILVERARRAHVIANEIEGRASPALGLRGDAIRLWEVRDSEVRANRVRRARDVVAWYAPGNLFADNELVGGRYGIHFMYSADCRVEGNRFDGDVVGVFVMYSRGVALRRNLIRRSAGAAGMGIGVKESGRIVVEDNVLAGNTIGLYLDGSPLDLREHNWITGNTFAGHDRAIVILGSSARNHFRGNALRDNAIQVSVEGGGSALDAEWLGNAYDDYLGYDLDGDGIGDVPHEERSLAAEWTERTPALALFRGTPALALVEWLGNAVPLFRPPTLLRDPAPRMQLELGREN